MWVQRTDEGARRNGRLECGGFPTDFFGKVGQFRKGGIQSDQTLEQAFDVSELLAEQGGEGGKAEKEAISYSSRTEILKKGKAAKMRKMFERGKSGANGMAIERTDEGETSCVAGKSNERNKEEERGEKKKRKRVGKVS